MYVQPVLRGFIKRDVAFFRSHAQAKTRCQEAFGYECRRSQRIKEAKARNTKCLSKRNELTLVFVTENPITLKPDLS